jgi:uncharacterized OB-fold protein
VPAQSPDRNESAGRPCPDCGTEVPAAASACPACGADLGDPDGTAAAGASAPG